MKPEPPADSGDRTIEAEVRHPVGCGQRVRVGWEVMMKGAAKPKKLQKKQPQKTLKQRRSEKRAAGKKFGST